MPSKTHEMDLQEALNLKTIKASDPAAVKIMFSSHRIALYSCDMKKKKYNDEFIQGTLFIYQRATPPYYAIFVLNVKSKENVLLPIDGTIDLKRQDTILWMRTGNNDDVKTVYFFTTEECTQAHSLCLQLVSSSKPVAQAASTSHTSNNSANKGHMSKAVTHQNSPAKGNTANHKKDLDTKNDILQMLHQAKQNTKDDEQPASFFLATPSKSAASTPIKLLTRQKPQQAANGHTPTTNGNPPVPKTLPISAIHVEALESPLRAPPTPSTKESKQRKLFDNPVFCKLLPNSNGSVENSGAPSAKAKPPSPLGGSERDYLLSLGVKPIPTQNDSVLISSVSNTVPSSSAQLPGSLLLQQLNKQSNPNHHSHTNGNATKLNGDVTEDFKKLFSSRNCDSKPATMLPPTPTPSPEADLSKSLKSLLSLTPPKNGLKNKQPSGKGNESKLMELMSPDDFISAPKPQHQHHSPPENNHHYHQHRNAAVKKQPLNKEQFAQLIIAKLTNDDDFRSKFHTYYMQQWSASDGNFDFEAAMSQQQQQPSPPLQQQQQINGRLQDQMQMNLNMQRHHPGGY